MKFFNLLIQFALIGVVSAQVNSLQELSKATEIKSEIVIYPAKEIITLDQTKPTVGAVAVEGKRIVALGSIEEIMKKIDQKPHRVDHTFSEHIIIPGLIGQHDHPVLTALTMVTEVIAIEDWSLPSGVIKAANNRDEYMQRISEAEAALKDPKEPLVTWGFHHYFHGKLTRSDLNKLSKKRPILVWHRSCHEFIMNDAALNMVGIDEAFMAQIPKSAQEQSNFLEGHFWEQGMFSILPKIVPLIATKEKLKEGLEFMVQFFHSAGVTLGCEPGGVLSKDLQNAQNAVLSSADSPFRFYFIPDGKSLASKYPNDTIKETEKVMTWGSGMTSMIPKQIKLFADGAIYSQLMQLKEPYTDGHKGEWMMDLNFFKDTFKTYWDAEYQIHIHVNGDAGLEMVLNTLEENMKRKPRVDHRTVIVHFAVSSKDQVDRIKKLGAIVSANSYYPVALADKYGEAGLGPERADPMTRMGDVENAGIPYSFHSDMPMAPGQPLFLMHCGVNRITKSGRVAAPEQRVSRLGALKAVTIGAAYSLQLENELGSIEVGKLANFTILGDNPVTCDALKIKDIDVWGTVSEGRILPVKKVLGTKQTTIENGTIPLEKLAVYQAVSSDLELDPYDPLNLSKKSRHKLSVTSCSCALGKELASFIFSAR